MRETASNRALTTTPGPVVRIGPSSLSFASPSALRDIYQTSRIQNQLRKSDYYKTVDAPAGAYSTHTETDFKKHAFRRRIIDHAFSDASMRSAEGFILQNIETFCEVIGPASDEVNAWSHPRDMSHHATYFAYDVMGDLVFGKRFDCMISSEHRYVPELISKSSWLMYWIAHLPLQLIVRRIVCSQFLMGWIGGQTAQAEHDFVAYASSCVKARIEREEKTIRFDMMHYLLNARDPETGKPFTNEDLDAESSLLIAAGADTTSSTLAAAFFYLTLPSSKDILARLQRHLREEFTKASEITWSATKNNTYLRAVVEEALRMAPAAPAELPRTISHKPGIEIAGHFVPAGTTVGCSAYVLHHDEVAYPDSFSFRPERWIVGEVEPDVDSANSSSTDATSLQSVEQVARAREAFCPFSLGSRGCPGKTLAYMELCLPLARILWEFDMRRADDSCQVSVRSKEYARSRGLPWREDEYQLKDVFIVDRAGPVVEFRSHVKEIL